MRRERTNTPLQALLLMNESQYVESARHLAQQAMKNGGDIAAGMFRRATSRPPDAQDLEDLKSAHADFLQVYQADREAAKKLIAVGESKPDATLDPSELAAWTMTANLILNLEEVITKP